MRTILAISGACCLLSAVALARPVRVWTYEDLHKEADVVAVVKVTKVVNTDTALAGYGEAKQYQGKRATAIVGLMVKGKSQPTLAFDFFAYAVGVSTPPNGAMFADLSKADRSHYVVFLKRLDDGTLIPVSGHYDAATSICEIAAGGLIEVKERAE